MNMLHLLLAAVSVHAGGSLVVQQNTNLIMSIVAKKRKDQEEEDEKRKKAAAEKPILAMPDPYLTPGVADKAVTKEMVCTRGYTNDARHVSNATKKKVFRGYGILNYRPADYEVDHLISLELGGANDILNLWPEPIAEARLKDVVETCLHRRVCHGVVTLREAQKGIASDWYSLYPGCRGKRHGKRKASK